MTRNLKQRPALARIVAALTVAALSTTAIAFSTGGVASAQTVKGDYQFQDSLADGPNTPDFQTVGPGTGFATETVDGVSRRVFTWPAGSGLLLTPTSQLNPTADFTIAILMRFQDVAGYRRIIDFKGGTDDRGLYVQSGALNFYNVASGPVSINPNTWVQVVLTRDDASKTVKGYVNGTEQFSFVDQGDLSIASEDSLRLFVDNGNGEHSAGAIARFRLFNDAMTATQVSELDRAAGGSSQPPPTPTPSPTPSTPSPTPSPTPPPTASPTPTAQPSTSPTAGPTPTPSPSTSTPPPTGTQFVTVRDANDTAGPLDIKKVVLGEVTFFYSIKLRLFGKIRRPALRRRGGPGVAWVYLDTAPDQGPRRPEYRVTVFHDGIDWGTETQRLSDGRTVGSDIADKINRRTLRFTFETEDVSLQQESIWFFAETEFKKRKGKCKVVCRDGAPNRGYVNSGPN